MKINFLKFVKPNHVLEIKSFGDEPRETFFVLFNQEQKSFFDFFCENFYYKKLKK